MPRITILPSGLSANAAPGDSLLAAGAKAGVMMDASCCSCFCGTCMVEVVSGGQNLEPPEPTELEVLNRCDRTAEKYRLACCSRVKTGEIVIRQLRRDTPSPSDQ